MSDETGGEDAAPLAVAEVVKIVIGEMREERREEKRGEEKKRGQRNKRG